MVLGVFEALPGHQPQNAVLSHHPSSPCSRKHFLVHSFPPHSAIPNHYIKPSPWAEHQEVSGSSQHNSLLMSSLLIRSDLSICHLDVSFLSSPAAQLSLLLSNSVCKGSISSCPPSKCCLTAAVQTLFSFLLSHIRHALSFMHFAYKFTSPCPFSLTFLKPKSLLCCSEAASLLPVLPQYRCIHMCTPEVRTFVNNS